MYRPSVPSVPRRVRTPLLALIVIILVAALPPAPGRAQGQRNIVERWRGTISVSQRFDTRGTPAEMVFTGEQLEQYNLRYDIVVDDEGFANGDIFITLNKVTMSVQGDRTCSAGGLRECTISTSVSQPLGSQFWEGRRFTDEQGRPRLKLETKVGNGTYPTTQTTVCGLIAPLYLSYICMPPDPINWVAGIPQEFVITPYQHGRPPLATPVNAHYSDPTIAWDYNGQLVGVGKEPLLDLDVELLERSRFFAEVPVDDQLDANIDWNSADAGHVSWQIGERSEQVGPTRERKVINRTNVGLPTPGTQTVQVQARNTLNQTSNPATTQMTAIRWPVSAGSAAAVGAVKLNKVVAYRYAYRFPNPPFSTEIKHVPDAVPFFGGGPLGISDTQAGGEVEILSTGEGFGKLDGKMTFKGMGSTITGAISVKAQAVLDDQFGVEFPSGEVSLSLAGKLENKESVLELVPALAGPVVALSRISPAAHAAINKLYVQAEIEPKFELLFKLKDNQGDLEFVSGEARPGVGIKANLVFELVPDTAVASVGIGGELVQGIQLPRPILKDTEIKLLANVKVVLGTYQFERESAVVCIYVGGGLNCRVPASLIASIEAELVASENLWRAVDRSYIQHADYGRWMGAEAPVKVAGLSDQRLVAVVSPQAEPAIAVQPDNVYGARNTYVVWAHDRPDLPLGSSRELMLASKNALSGWEGPRQLTNDDRDDWGVQLAMTPSNGLLALWQRMDIATPPDINADPNGYLSHMQIAASKVTLGGSPRVTPLQLSSGGLSYRPQLAATNTGGLAVWITNPGNQIGGDAANPDSLMFSRYTESSNSWSTAAAVLPPLAGLVDFHLATNGAHAAIVYTRDTDGDLSTQQDQDLFAVRWENGAWSAPQRLTNNGVADERPQLALAADGTPLIVWKRDGAMVFASGAWGAASQPLALPEAAERPDYQLVRAAGDNVALVWQENEPGDTRIGYAVYDRASKTWGAAHIVTPPIAATDARTTMATAIAPAMVTAANDSSKDRLIAAYLLAEVDSVTRTVDGTAMPNVQEVGGHSLRVVEERLGANLSISPADITVTPADAKPGQNVQVQVAVRNTGQLPVSGVPVELLSGDPDSPFSSPDVVQSKDLPLLRAGTTHTVTFTIKRPEEARDWSVNIPTVYKPCGQEICLPTLVETDYTDNYATIEGELSLAALPTTYTPQGVAVAARVTQTGALYTTAATSATLRLGAPDGPRVAAVAVAFPISRTETIEATAWISPTLLGQGRHTLYWELDPNQSLPDRNRVDNTLAIDVEVLPDLASSPELIGWGRAPGATAPLSMRVENRGSWASPASAAELWDGPPGATGSHRLGRITVPAIPAGGSVELNGTLQLSGTPAAKEGLKALYVRLDPDGSVAEVNESNNLIVAGAPAGAKQLPANRLYLPLLRR